MGRSVMIDGHHHERARTRPFTWLKTLPGRAGDVLDLPASIVVSDKRSRELSVVRLAAYRAARAHGFTNREIADVFNRTQEFIRTAILRSEVTIARRANVRAKRLLGGLDVGGA